MYWTLLAFTTSYIPTEVYTSVQLQEVIWCSWTLVPRLVSRCWVELWTATTNDTCKCEHNDILHNKVLVQRDVHKVVVHLQFAVIVNGFLSALINGVINFHNSRLVSASVAIVWSRENGNNLSVVLPLVPLHNKLVGTWNKVKPVDVSELFCNVLTERVASSPRRDTPTTSLVTVTKETRETRNDVRLDGCVGECGFS